MSRQLINEYRSDLDRLKQASGSLNEGVLRDAFQTLLKQWGKSADLTFIPEYDRRNANGNLIRVDGALVVADVRIPFGYWEAKDSKDDLEEEIRKKEAKGYPRSNIIYEDTQTAILIQNKRRVGEADMADTDALYALLSQFFAYEREEIADFRKAVIRFSEDLPEILDRLRELIRERRGANPDYAKAEQKFLNHAKDAINPAVEIEDVTEMLIQHILTEQIFAKVFDVPGFHEQNNVAKELYALEGQLFDYGGKRKLLQKLQPYYAGITANAALIDSHSEKQGFLKSLYENFYKVYNPKAADRLGVVYTPGEIVRFMIRSADHLCEQHFGKNLIDKGVEILDPATGTGTYIVELLEYFRGDREKLKHKYNEELHANEVAILPYYVANLNIEATYQAITGEFEEFPSLCLVDTLDNVDGLGIHAGHQHDLLAALSDENIERVKRQNRRKISVIIGNPPYNANQQNENDNNKNRTYPHIDKRIKDTYIKASTAQKTKLYDMYSRFYRWASDRLGDEGIIAFVTNRSFLEARTFDGFRKKIAEDFDDIFVVDLGGDVRANPKLSGTTHNVFGIQTGVAIAFLVRTKDKASKTIRYVRRPEMEVAIDKLSWLQSENIPTLQSETIRPNKRNNWLNQADYSEWDTLLPIADKATKTAEIKRNERAIFKLFSLGQATNRDDWAYDLNAERLKRKIIYFQKQFNRERKRRVGGGKGEPSKLDIKWSSELIASLPRSKDMRFDEKAIRPASYRPFISKYYYHDDKIVHRFYQAHNMIAFPFNDFDKTITFLCVSSDKPMSTLASNQMFDLCYTKVGNGGSNGVSRYRYTSSGERIDNITDWALNKFTKNYGKKGGITKDAVFHYCYAVLHDPVYREKYALNLKREFPRIPFYPDFARWAEWGERLMQMHIHYEDVAPWDIERIDTPNPKRAKHISPKPKLKSDPEKGLIIIDEDTQLTGIPASAWDYRLGNRSAIDWVLDQHKEKKPRDPTIAAKFNTYKFIDYKESCIDLLAKVVRISMDTNSITDAMCALDRNAEHAKPPL